MNSSFRLTTIAVVVVSGLGLATRAHADATPASSSDATMSCRQLMAKAESLIAKMPAGVEKMSAQKEIASAKVEMSKGEMLGCKTRVHNAMEAIQSK